MTTEESYIVAIYDYYNVLFSTPLCVLREWVFDDPKTGHFILFLLSLSPQNHINYIIYYLNGTLSVMLAGWQ